MTSTSRFEVLMAQPGNQRPATTASKAPMRNFGNVFSTTPGRCFRFITDGFGRPGQCVEEVAAHGIFLDESGHGFEVDACEIHATDLDSGQSISRK